MFDPVDILQKQKSIIPSLKGHRASSTNSFDKWKRDTTVAIEKYLARIPRTLRNFPI